MELFCRKRGGSVDNLLDDLDGPIGGSSPAEAAAAAAAGNSISQESKKKSLSSKNLSNLHGAASLEAPPTDEKVTSV